VLCGTNYFRTTRLPRLDQVLAMSTRGEEQRIHRQGRQGRQGRKGTQGPSTQNPRLSLASFASL